MAARLQVALVLCLVTEQRRVQGTAIGALSEPQEIQLLLREAEQPATRKVGRIWSCCRRSGRGPRKSGFNDDF